eukprot:TRINITY_DN12561_c0_g1_i1.p1 TRINITY_DN12561_c0_g1~~TRINITY_DN12561_c0_g1_i1.p1  ORF type:complete len:393 (+),score=61.29 TRINITY_DN12561_c0_g1_i1:88-1179(+)
MIADFIADSNHASLELPPMDIGQRKYVKNILAGHPDLTCESFGFGSERKLHIFKKTKKSDVSDGAKESALPTKRRSDSKPTSIREVIAARFSQVPCKEAQKIGEVQSPRQSTATTADTTPSDKSSSPCDRSALSQVLQDSELQPLEERIQVRNTFIEIKDMPTDDRAVRSMPHGMFRRLFEDEIGSDGAGTVPCSKESSASSVDAVQSGNDEFLTTLGEEWFFTELNKGVATDLKRNSSAKLEPTDPVFAEAPLMSAPQPPPPPAHLAVGTEVVIEGLWKFPIFNGLHGVVQSLDCDTGRYTVAINSPAAPGGHQWAKVKAENLRLAAQAQSAYFASTFPAEDYDYYNPLENAATWLQLTAMV